MYRLYLALRWLVSRPINVLGMLGVTVGVWALIVVVSIFSGFIKEVRAHVRSASSDVSVQYLGWGASFAALERTIMADPNVVACAPRLVWYGLMHALGKHRQVLPAIRPNDAPGADCPFVMLIGIDPAREVAVTGFGAWLTDVAPTWKVADPARAFARAGDQAGILLSQRRLEHEFVDPGARIELTSGRLGRRLDLQQHEFTLAGAFATRHVAFDDTSAFVPIERLRTLLSPEEGDVVNELVVKVKDPQDDRATAARLERALHRDHPHVAAGARVRTWEQMNEMFLQTVEHQRFLMKIVLFVIMVVAAFLMYATLSMMVAEKTRDIGILAALGASRGGVLQVFLTCGIAIAVCGAGLGVALGCVSAVELDSFNTWMRDRFGLDLFPSSIYNLKRVPYELDPWWIALVAGLALSVGILVSALPAWRAARHDPVQSLRNE